jgi:mitochondrial fission protein ELM1
VGDGSKTVWCLLGKKAGDNTQVRALAAELGWNCQEKHIAARPWELFVHLGDAQTLAGINQSQSSPLAAPWPDIVISAGRRNEPVARWIRAQSGGKTRLVHIGRPWAPLAQWDLIVTTAQYFLPVQSNIVHNSLPLHRPSAQDYAQAGQQLEQAFEHLPRPWVAVLVGGNSGRFVMTASKGRHLGTLAQELGAAADGSVLATDSARTPRAAGDAFQTQLRPPCFCYRWGSAGDNPYQGLLASADAFIVTGESMSMLAEAADTGKPLYIFNVDDGARRWWMLPHNYRYKPLSHRVAMRFGPRRMRRDIGNIQKTLVDTGRAQWLTLEGVIGAAKALRAGTVANTREPPEHTTSQQDLQRAAQAVRQLVITP